MDEEFKKYGIVEMIIGGLGFLFIDIICIVIDLTGVGLAIAPIIQSFGTFTMNWWAWKKDDKDALKLGKQIAKYAANLLPIIPTLTIVFLATALIHNRKITTSAFNSEKTAKIIKKKIIPISAK